MERDHKNSWNSPLRCLWFLYHHLHKVVWGATGKVVWDFHDCFKVGTWYCGASSWQRVGVDLKTSLATKILWRPSMDLEGRKSGFLLGVQLASYQKTLLQAHWCHDLFKGHKPSLLHALENQVYKLTALPNTCSHASMNARERYNHVSLQPHFYNTSSLECLYSLSLHGLVLLPHK